MTELNLSIGSVIIVADIEFLVLDITETSILCLTKNFVSTNTRFDNSTNNYAVSEIRNWLTNEFYKNLVESVGESAFNPIEIDLLTDDGLDDYGKIEECFGLLTCDMYRRFNRIIERYPVPGWWWLITAYSTERRGYSRIVRCVRRGGTLNGVSCGNTGGVRPFVNFKSSFFNLNII